MLSRMRPGCRRAALLFLCAGALFAQSSSIQGTLFDPQGASIPNAKISAVDEAKGIVARETTSQADGRFVVQPLLRGTYTIRAELTGFKTAERTGVVLDPNQVLNLGDIRLDVGQTTEQVTVEAQVPLVETSTAQKSYVITSKQVTELALNGRAFSSLMRTLPGVTSNSASDFRLTFNETNDFNVNGLRSSMNNVYLDGTINTDVGDNGGQYTQLNLDAVGEFKVQSSNFNAEYGRNAGILISATTKSGSNQIHGVGYDFFRNDKLDARFPFDTTGRPARLRYNQFGGNIGGPIPIPGYSTRDDRKLFFFAAYEGVRGAQPNGGQFVDLPHPDLLNGDLSRLLRPQPIVTAPQFQLGTVFRPGTITRDGAGNITGGVPYAGNIVPRSEWSRNAPAFLSILQRANYAAAQAVPNSPELVRIPIQDTYRLTKNQKVARIDWSINPKNNFFFRWVDDAQSEQIGLGVFATTPFPVYPMFRKKPGSSWSYNLINVISPTTTNEFIFGYTHQSQLVDVAPGTDPSTYELGALGFRYGELFPDANVRDRFPRFNCGVGNCNFGGFASTWENDGKDYAFTDNVTFVRGRHTFKVGGFYNLDDKQQQPSWNDAGNFNFGGGVDNPNDANSTFGNLLLGNYLNFQQSNGKFLGDFRFQGVEAYAQDSWKVNRKLTLEYGLRYVYLGPTYTRGELLQNYFDPTLYNPAQAVRLLTTGATRGGIQPGVGNPFNGIVQENSGGIPSGFARHRFNNVSPRFGFAYDVTGTGRTAIRGGFGTFYERVRQNVTAFDGLGNPPLLYTPTLFAGNIDNLSASLISGGVRFPVGLSAIDGVGKIPTIGSWSLGVQHELPGKVALETSYVGNVGRHLQYRRNINQLPLGTTVSNPTLLPSVNNQTNALRPFLGYTDINITESGASSNYHSLQTRVTRRFGQSLTANASYTWSKAISEVDGDGDVIGYYLDRLRERGPASFDRTHVLTFDYVYDFPKVGTLLSENGAVRRALDGWQLSGITRYWSGRPFTVGSGGNPGVLSGGGVRADYIGTGTGDDLYPEEKTRFQYFNPFVFARPQDGVLGNTGKGILRGPGIRQWDISLFKNIPITEGTRLQFRFETFNTFNTVQWDGVNTGINVPNRGQAVTAATVGTTGQVTSTRPPRNIQLALKLYF